MTRKLVGSGSPFEGQIGFSRAVRAGGHISVAGTAAIGPDGRIVGVGDVYRQTVRCLEIVADALAQAGAGMEHVVRTRIMLTDMESWRDAARAHGEVFAGIRPACTFVEVSGFIDPEWRVEIEVDAIVSD